MTNLKLIFYSPNLWQDTNISVRDRAGSINYTTLHHQNNITSIETKIQLANILYITTKQKNIELKEFWLGNIKASTIMLSQICNFTFEDNTQIWTTVWHLPGTATIELFSNSFIEFHLYHNNVSIN
jgi:hypothetical protein